MIKQVVTGIQRQISIEELKPDCNIVLLIRNEADETAYLAQVLKDERSSTYYTFGCKITKDATFSHWLGNFPSIRNCIEDYMCQYNSGNWSLAVFLVDNWFDIYEILKQAQQNISVSDMCQELTKIRKV